MCKKKFLSTDLFRVFVLQKTYSHLQYVVIEIYIATLLTDSQQLQCSFKT